MIFKSFAGTYMGNYICSLKDYLKTLLDQKMVQYMNISMTKYIASDVLEPLFLHYCLELHTHPLLHNHIK